jgi:hypothetical protein
METTKDEPSSGPILSNTGQEESQEEQTKQIQKPTRVQLRTRMKKQLMLQALKKTHGIVVYAAPLAKIERTAHNAWMNRDPKYRAAVENLQEETLDIAEGVVQSVMITGERPDLALKAATFYLENKGSKRGYGKTGVAVQVNNSNQNNVGVISQLKALQDKHDQEANTHAGQNVEQTSD